MQLAAIPRWQWVIIAVVVGATVGFITDTADSQLYGINVQGYGMLLSDQQEFESGLVQDYNGIRLFNNPVVYPHWTKALDGQRKLVYIVSGQYWDGHETLQNGKTIAEWMPRCVITSTPYKPRISIAEGSGAAAETYPSVVEFLEAVHRVYKVNYRYAWWALHPVLTWVVGCLIVIGGIWPTVANLLSYGTFRRPPEVKAVSLWNIRKPRAHPTSPLINYSASSSGTDEEFKPESAAQSLDNESDATPIRALSATPLESTPEGPHDDRTYGADNDDFYPTERHAPRTKPL